MVGKMDFKIGDIIIYPSHGIGKIIDIIDEKILDVKVKMYKINFQKKQLVLSIPIASPNIALRNLSSKDVVMEILLSFNSSITKKKRLAWGKCSAEYDKKMSSGDIRQIAEIVRELHNSTNENRCYSERFIYENAMNVLVEEISCVLGIDSEEVRIKILESFKNMENKITQT